MYADRPVFSATLVHGTRRQVLFSSHYYGRPLPPLIFSFYDFYPLLMDRTVWVHISDTSWPDDTLIELEYMDEAPLGRAAVTSFPSGYEVWVYNDKLELPALAGFVPVLGSVASAVEMTAQNRELVILFDPSGTVRRYQMRVDGSRLEKLAGP
ncbi:hypothetical protein ACZ75_18315 [Massilia sp. NR 4-1]|nr:hypothetical protein ACZ75_18315 [Massilia sp. NR 4-1]